MACANRECKKTGTLSAPLKPCARCRRSEYCSKACQVKHWPTHKGLCPGSRKNVIGPNIPQFKLDLPDTKESMHKLIDVFRLRCDDDYTWGQHNHGIYGGENPLPMFTDYLDRAEAVGALPSWWTPAKRAEILQIALSESNYSIRFAQEKSDIMKGWKDDAMPLKMRMFAENVYGGGYGLGQQPMPDGYQCLCVPP